MKVHVVRDAGDAGGNLTLHKPGEAFPHLEAALVTHVKRGNVALLNSIADVTDKNESIVELRQTTSLRPFAYRRNEGGQCLPARLHFVYNDHVDIQGA